MYFFHIKPYTALVLNLVSNELIKSKSNYKVGINFWVWQYWYNLWHVTWRLMSLPHCKWSKHAVVELPSWSMLEFFLPCSLGLKLHIKLSHWVLATHGGNLSNIFVFHCPTWNAPAVVIFWQPYDVSKVFIFLRVEWSGAFCQMFVGLYGKLSPTQFVNIWLTTGPNINPGIPGGQTPSPS